MSPEYVSYTTHGKLSFCFSVEYSIDEIKNLKLRRLGISRYSQFSFKGMLLRLFPALSALQSPTQALPLKKTRACPRPTPATGQLDAAASDKPCRALLRARSPPLGKGGHSSPCCFGIALAQPPRGQAASCPKEQTVHASDQAGPGHAHCHGPHRHRFCTSGSRIVSQNENNDRTNLV